jgi:hypothetical protein
MRGVIASEDRLRIRGDPQDSEQPVPAVALIDALLVTLRDYLERLQPELREEEAVLAIPCPQHYIRGLMVSWKKARLDTSRRFKHFLPILKAANCLLYKALTLAIGKWLPIIVADLRYRMSAQCTPA